jgi:hypothetical protein
MSSPQKTQAMSLLEDILLETKSEADAEMKRLEDEVRRREEAARREAELQDSQRRAEAERKLAEEEQRQLAAAERRAQELERMRIEELKSKGLWKEPEKPVAEVPALQSAAAAPGRPVMTTAEAVAIQKRETRSSRTLVAAAAIAILGVGGSVGGVLYANSIEYVDATTTWAKSEITVVAMADTVASLTLQAIPEPPPPPAAEDAATEAAPPANRRPGVRRPPTPQPTGPGPGPIRINRGGSAF